MAEWLETEVIAKRVWTPQLFSLRVAGPSPRFEAGQFAKLALDLDGERVGRAFSFVNPYPRQKVIIDVVPTRASSSIPRAGPRPTQ